MSSSSFIPPRLVIIEGKDKGKVIPLKAGTVIIGRSKGDVLVHDPRISRSHIAIHFDDTTGLLSFTDLKSLNGTQLNGENSQKGELHDGDKLQLGDTTFDCQMFSENDSADKTLLAETKAPKTAAPTLSQIEPLGGTIEAEHRIENWEENTNTNAQGVVAKPRSLLRVAYTKVPASIRHLGLGGILLFFTLVYFGKNSTPDAAELEKRLGEVKRLGDSGSIEGATTLARSLQRDFPEHSVPFMILGDLHLRQEDYESAILAYQKATEYTPPQPLAHIRLLKLYLKTGLKDQVEKEMQIVDSLLREDAPNKQVFIEAGELYLENKDLKQPPEKVFILAKALQNSLAPETTIGYKLEAKVLFEQNRTKEALDTLTAGRKIDPGDQWILENAAFARLSLNDFPGALETVEDWITRYPSASKALLVMAYLKYNSKNYLGALPFAQKIVQLGADDPAEPHYSEALNLVGQIYLEQNQVQEAETFLKQACEMGFQKSCAHPLVQSKVPASVPDPLPETKP